MICNELTSAMQPQGHLAATDTVTRPICTIFVKNYGKTRSHTMLFDKPYPIADASHLKDTNYYD